jgi:hypothetical protein
VTTLISRGSGAPLSLLARGAFVFFLIALTSCEGCLPRVQVDTVALEPYPSCGDETDVEVLGEGYLRSGPTMREQTVSERWRLERRGCLNAMVVHQAWERQITDVEVLYDASWRPVRAWKRMAVPGAPPDGRPDVRVYQLGDEVTMRRSSPEGQQAYRVPGPSPVAVVGPGRALLTAWIRAAGPMEVGDVVRGPVLDFRRLVEKVDEVALRRDPDRDEPSLGGRVRVYTVFGRESIFTDDAGNVVGDLAGLRTHESLRTPEPPPLPEYGEPDPRGTP